MGALGRKAVVEVSLDGTDYTDITKENRINFDVTITEAERTRNDGDGLLAHDLTGHADGEVSFTIDSTAETRPFFAIGGGRRIWYRYSPEGSETGDPHTIYQTLNAITKTFEDQGAVTYTITGTIEVEPTEDAH